MPSAQNTAPDTTATTSRVPTAAWSTHRTSRSDRADRVTVAVYAADPVLRLGVVQQLRQRPEVDLLADADDGAEQAQVSLVVVDRVDDDVAALLHRLRHNTATRTGLVVATLGPGSLQRVIECGVAAVLRRAEADQDQLLRLVLAIANGEGMLPGDLLGKLLSHVGSLQRSSLDPRSLSLSTLTTREADMLRMVSEGLDTAEIARKTAYSERTVKNVLHEVITRLQLRNRAHAVGYALRNGLI
ncbi:MULTISPECIES: response regulator transcription factor [Streptomyces]|uniref:Response regulator transcription factor n=3 Tax=Streptomyces TaxID=1883 RepID=A0ABS9JST7_9ACTN|nr:MULTISPECIES: response regulator transcription factor [Streptomyces]MCG0068631.1 response regulator transcription factor [Streptomyces tricolor]OYP16679.1 DNA-binding response regulator [Streptomyces sp. FBKL.4005]BCM67910.1 putative LuxR-family transcriptional regulator [Streptomyces sp. EAS-AB2608]CUW29251.1 Transcriptional regulatory protein LiaR [Streptomyces reticuli]